MTNKNLFGAVAVAAVALAVFSSCDKSPKADDKQEAKASAPTELKLAYVENSIELEKKGKRIQATLQQKGQDLQRNAANFQQKLQQNAYTREQAEQIQAGLQKQNADLEALQQRLGAEFQEETNKFNAALRDSLQHFLAVYNKDKKYTMILSKSGDNILLADKSIDITAEVIAGLNKAYKKTAKKADADDKAKK